MEQFEQADDFGLQKPYRGYADAYIIIENSEQLKEKFQGKKIKKAWLNEKGKLCLVAFIYLGSVEDEQIVIVDVIGGKSSHEKEDRKTIPLSDLFAPKNLIFVGFVNNDKIEEELRAKEMGLY